MSALLVGIALGLGPPILLGYYAASPWWIVLVALLATVLPNFTDHYNAIRSASRKGTLARTIFWRIGVSTLIQSGIFYLLYLLGSRLAG